MRLPLFRNIHFYLILLLFIVVASLQYIYYFYDGIDIGISSISLYRVLLLGPIIYAAVVFSLTGGLITSISSLVISLPGAVINEAFRLDALLEVSGIFITGIIITIWRSTQSREKAKEKQTIAELNRVRQTLQDSLDTLTVNEKRLSMLNNISTTLFSILDLKELFARAVKMVPLLISADAMLLYYMDENRQRLTLTAHQGIPDDIIHGLSKISVEGLYAEVINNGSWCISSEVSRWVETGSLQNAGIRQQLVIPLILQEEVKGLICVAEKEKRDFTLYEINMLTAAATAIAVAIENARLYEGQIEISRQLTVSEGKYRRLFDSASDAIWVNNMAGKITNANRAAGELMGFVNAEELIGQDARSFLPPSGLTIARKVRRAFLHNETLEQPYELKLIRVDGSEIILMVSTSLVKHPDEPPTFEHVARDVTKERRIQDNLRQFVQQITKSQEDERRRIARDLHDDTVQDLYAMTRQLDNYIRKNGESINRETTTFLKNLEDQIKKASQGVRRFSQDLRPPMLDDLGLLATLRWLMSGIKERSNMEIAMLVEGTEKRLAPHVELAIFRIVQEAIRNIEKHAQASKVTMLLNISHDMLSISITDNGRGFKLIGEVEELPRAGRLGLVGMEERARLLGGTINIHSEIEKGTTVFVKVPL